MFIFSRPSLGSSGRKSANMSNPEFERESDDIKLVNIASGELRVLFQAFDLLQPGEIACVKPLRIFPVKAWRSEDCLGSSPIEFIRFDPSLVHNWLILAVQIVDKFCKSVYVLSSNHGAFWVEIVQ